MIIDLIFDENSIANESLCTDMTRDRRCMAPQSREFSRFAAKQRTLPALDSPTAHLSQDVMHYG